MYRVKIIIAIKTDTEEIPFESEDDSYTIL